ncbi:MULTISPECIES: 3',5'-cyclic-AMP phosphodiesterase [unclassified Leptolyngbya]|uniref:3',5'-cyclic-AMP phosphodiesterase n=1 Tax=unclassified Leptolyngbya TaxID=2650499 RepID=UPI001688E201|nr:MULTISPECIES: 3',5'-cyclic-AMP phosphodiesterase [unclassified Leptolyngbya]MBD1912405.1 3',5'-cyclic-AMP phosphodiesterase [Leptolyngbya sp. FACHB-8]MBD2154809.1 3',5'-cyclic-AMP phosphodiesterase [Leptolyngbya sp. FACHB-16]
MPSNSLLIAQLTDTHLFADESSAMMGIQSAASLQAVADQVRSLPRQPDIVLLTGDLSQDETPESYERLRETIAPLGATTYWIPGNHDIPAIMQPILQDGVFQTTRGFQTGGWNVVLLDTAVPEQPFGELAEAQLTFLDQQLQAASELPGLVVLHHPPCPVHCPCMDAIRLQNADAFYKVLDQHPQVKIVLFGHIHQEFEGDRQGVTYLGSPSTCVQLKSGSDNFEADSVLPGFRLLELFPDGRFSTRVERIPALPSQI